MRINSLQLFNRRRRRQTREHLSNEDYSWIWKPFKDAKDSKLAQTACLAAEIIANSSPEKIPKVPFNLDPRIVIPLCAIALQNDLNNIEKLNRQKTSSIYDTVNYFLKTTHPSPRWLYLFNSLPTQLQYNLCYRLSNFRLCNKDDWRNVFKNNSYQFNTSLHYDFILAILLVSSLIAIIGMYSFLIININIFLSIVVIWSFITLVTFWFHWGKQGFYLTSLRYINSDNDFINAIGILAFIVFILGTLVDIFLLISNSNWFSFSTINFFLIGFCGFFIGLFTKTILYNSITNFDIINFGFLVSTISMVMVYILIFTLIGIDNERMIFFTVFGIIFQLLGYVNKSAWEFIAGMFMLSALLALLAMIIFSFLNMFDNKSIVSYLSISAFFLITIIGSILVIENIYDIDDSSLLIIIWLVICLIIGMDIGGIIGGITGLSVGGIIGLIIMLVIGEYDELILCLIIGGIICLIIGGIIGMYIGGDIGMYIGGIIGMYIGGIIGMYIERFRMVIRKFLKRLFMSTLVLFSFLSTLYFVNYTLINLLSLESIQVLLFWLTTLGIGGTLYRRGKTLDYEARNPLKGILDNTINN